MGKYESIKRKDGAGQFNLQAGNGQVILTGEGHVNKNACLNGIKSVRKNSQDGNAFEHFFSDIS